MHDAYEKDRLATIEQQRAIIKKLVRVLDAYDGGEELISNQGQAMDGFSALANFVSVARKAKKTLP